MIGFILLTKKYGHSESKILINKSSIVSFTPVKDCTKVTLSLITKTSKNDEEFINYHYEEFFVLEELDYIMAHMLD